MIRKESSCRSAGVLLAAFLLNCGGSTPATGQKTTAGDSDGGGITSGGSSTGASATTTASGTGGTGGSGGVGSTGSTIGGISSTSSTSGNSSTSGTSATGSTTAGWSACNGPGQCEIDLPGCCGTCRVPTIDDVVAVAVVHHDEFRMATCPAPTPCPSCVNVSNPNLAARCVSGSCAAFDVSTDPGLSACMRDSDCVLRAGLKCCPLGPDWVAVRADAESALQTTLCAPGGACAAIAPVPPANTFAACSAGVCTVAATGPTSPNDAGPACATRATCAGVNLNPPELTFEAAYCSGSLCNATTQSTCEATDVVTDCNTLTAGSDGRADCRWGMAIGGFTCQVNK